MYNRYIPGASGYTRVIEEDAPPRSARADSASVPSDPPPTEEASASSPSSGRGLSALLKKLKLEHLDTGDLLLLLILLLLVLEGDDLELILTLGLLLLFGLEDSSA